MRRYGQREPAARRTAASMDALVRLGRTKMPRLSASQRAMLERWAPLVLALTTQGRWSSGDRARLLQLILAKAGPSERDFQHRLLRHKRLGALLGC
jgi:hypothetical protein